MRVAAISFALLFATTGQVLAQYKCKSANGAVAFQDVPCSGGDGEKVKINMAPPTAADLQKSAVRTQRDIGRAQYLMRRDDAIAARQVFIGMKAEDVIASWGYPTKKNVSMGNYGRAEQWVYERGAIGRSQYVYVDNDVVSSIQSPE